MELPPISELIPHEPPMLALDRLTAWRKGHAEAELTIRPENPFARDGAVGTVMALEYMAQAVAACLGMEAYVAGGNVRVGMVIACRKMSIHRPSMAVGETFAVRADEVRASDAVSHYDGELRAADGELVASCTMTLVHGEKPPE